MGKPAPTAPAEKVALYDKLVDSVPGIERKGAKNPYTSINGHMFSFLTPAGKLALRLSKSDREAFASKYKTEPCIMYDTVMKEYVLVPDSMLAKTATVKKYFLMSVDYVGSLKPKPTTKSKKKTGTKKTSNQKTAGKSMARPVAKKKKTTTKVRKHR